MAAPISNSGPALIGNNKTPQSDAERLARGTGQTVATEANEPGEEAVTVSRAAQLLNQQSDVRHEGVIKSAEQAAQLAKGLSALFSANSGQALSAQAGSGVSDLMGLLKAG